MSAPTGASRLYFWLVVLPPHSDSTPGAISLPTRAGTRAAYLLATVTRPTVDAALADATVRLDLMTARSLASRHESLFTFELVWISSTKMAFHTHIRTQLHVRSHSTLQKCRRCSTASTLSTTKH
ncbi:hypothetical protein GQ44DRAFT_308998 [Phaeosphaeriaceae sp. PMI808]|nr:hypothetical protein GQ44DRAFT_308998 [Phaeosphaeriaceae sp. PMI808]